jgi:(p)ppGpp synthase/HD superfamily hydrolase
MTEVRPAIPTDTPEYARYKKLKLALKQWLLGRNYHFALRAMALAERYHTGLRKDGKTPEFFHQIEIALFISTLEPHLLYPEATIVVALLHDVAEDYNVSWEEIAALFGTDVAFAALVLDALKAITKEYRGVKKSPKQYAADCAANAIASIVKGVDRINNHQSMIGPFTLEKQKSYLVETEELILFVVRTAQDDYPEQNLAYENIKWALKSQMQLIRAIHVAHEERG